MDIKDLKELCKTEPREVEFVFLDHKTGWFFTLLHDSSPEVSAFMKKYHAKVRNLSLKRKTNAINNLAEQHADDLRAIQVSDWRWEKGPAKGRPEFSKKELKIALKDPDFGWHLAAFIDEEVGSLEDFLAKSGQD